MLNKLTTPGRRVRYARLIAGFHSRKSLSEKHGLSHNTLQGWEQGKSNLTRKGAIRLSNLFLREGVQCSPRWLLDGQGEPPCPIHHTPAAECGLSCSNSTLHHILAQEPTIIQRQIQEFRQAFKDVVITRVYTNAFAPFYEADDLVGGVRLEEGYRDEKIANKLCITELHNGSMFVGFVKINKKGQLCVNSGHLTAKYQQSFEKERVKSVIPIIWHRRSLSSALEQGVQA